MNPKINPSLMLRIISDDHRPIAFDTETTGITIRDKICGYVITNNENSLYSPVRHEAGGNIPNAEEYEHALASAFKDRGRHGFRTIGHNVGFDLRICLRHGVVLYGPLEDSMINEAIISDITMGYSLEECCARRNVIAKKGSEVYAELARRFGGLPDRKQMKNLEARR